MNKAMIRLNGHKALNIQSKLEYCTNKSEFSCHQAMATDTMHNLAWVHLPENI